MVGKKKAKTPKYVTKVRSSYDPWITLKKVLYTALIVGGISALTYIVDAGVPSLVLAYPEYSFLILLGSAFLVGLINALKHYKDTITVKVNTVTGEEEIIG
jgi:hypothetical protein